jgi:hypothetical protein
METKTMFLLFRMLLACPLCALALCALADDQPADNADKRRLSIDEKLLESLDTGPLDRVDEQATSKPSSGDAEKNSQRAEPPGSEKPAGKSATASDLDKDLLGELGGEEVSASRSPSDPLAGIGRQMRTVEGRLIEKQLDDQTQVMQKKILDDLAALMQECKKECQGSGGNKSGSKPGKAGKGGQGGGSPATQAPTDTARNSSEKLRQRDTEGGERPTPVNAMKESWGNLPEHMRKHIANVKSDAFLPKYELMLEKYFKRLGEENENER